jgi:hypothetical protein
MARLWLPETRRLHARIRDRPHPSVENPGGSCRSRTAGFSNIGAITGPMSQLPGRSRCSTARCSLSRQPHKRPGRVDTGRFCTLTPPAFRRWGGIGQACIPDSSGLSSDDGKGKGVRKAGQAGPPICRGAGVLRRAAGTARYRRRNPATYRRRSQLGTRLFHSRWKRGERRISVPNRRGSRCRRWSRPRRRYR